MYVWFLQRFLFCESCTVYHFPHFASVTKLYFYPAYILTFPTLTNSYLLDGAAGLTVLVGTAVEAVASEDTLSWFTPLLLRTEFIDTPAYWHRRTASNIERYFKYIYWTALFLSDSFYRPVSYKVLRALCRKSWTGMIFLPSPAFFREHTGAAIFRPFKTTWYIDSIKYCSVVVADWLLDPVGHRTWSVLWSTSWPEITRPSTTPPQQQRRWWIP